MSQQAKGCRNCGTAHRKISLDCAKRKSPKKANVAGEDNFWGFLKIRFLETVRTKPDVFALQELSFNYIRVPVWAVQWPERISWDFVLVLFHQDGYAVQVGWSEARLCLWLWKDCLTLVGRFLLLNCKGLPRLNLSVVPSCPAGSGLRKVLPRSWPLLICACINGLKSSWVFYSMFGCISDVSYKWVSALWRNHLLSVLPCLKPIQLALCVFFVFLFWVML